MIGHERYVPILRWKEAERLALRDLGEDTRDRITPLVQLVPESIATGKRIRTAREALQKVAQDMRECWGRSDSWLTCAESTHALRSMGTRTHLHISLGLPGQTKFRWSP